MAKHPPNYFRDYFRAQGEKRREYLRARYRADPSKQAAASKRYREKHRDKVRARNNSPEYRAKRCEWAKQNPDKMAVYRKRRILRQRGVDTDWYETTLTAQHNCCAICKSEQPGGRLKLFAVDHCHATNVIRGLLCNECNGGLGFFRDKPELLYAAASYLAKHQKLDFFPRSL